ncbi:hypothetical protein, partial [Nodularia spumigena]|uniref:hypothetical protein n=1 Tax=Nodularia spumigena TaxID=70799 RepID=UPI002B1FD96E
DAPPTDAPPTDAPPIDPDAHLIAFLAGRSAPCPRCAYDLRDIRAPKCPECAEPLLLKVGSPNARFGWLLLAMVPGSFSGVAALFVMIPIGMTLLVQTPFGQGPPWPIIVADIFGFTSAATVVLMYRHRHRVMAWATRRQIAFAATIWAIHVLALALVIGAMLLWA